MYYVSVLSAECDLPRGCGVRPTLLDCSTLC